jgi:hypothetical protein
MMKTQRKKIKSGKKSLISVPSPSPSENKDNERNAMKLPGNHTTMIDSSSNTSTVTQNGLEEREQRPHPSSLFDDEDDLKNIAFSSMQLRNQIQLSLQKNPSANERSLFQNMTDEDLAGQNQQQQQLIHYQIDPSQRKPIIKRINLLTGEGILEELEHEIQQTISSALDVCTRTLDNSIKKYQFKNLPKGRIISRRKSNPRNLFRREGRLVQMISWPHHLNKMQIFVD